MSDQHEARLWGPERIAEAFAKVAKPDGTVGEEEIMFVIQGIIEEYEFAHERLEQRLAEASEAIETAELRTGHYMHELNKLVGKMTSDKDYYSLCQRTPGGPKDE